MAEEFTEPLKADGTLSDETLALVQRHIVEKLKRCPACGQDQFVIEPRIYAPIAVGYGRHIDFGNIHPQVFVICQSCFYIMPFGARLLGLYKLIPTETKDG
jgi:hypothetical protein